MRRAVVTTWTNGGAGVDLAAMKALRYVLVPLVVAVPFVAGIGVGRGCSPSTGTQAPPDAAPPYALGSGAPAPAPTPPPQAEGLSGEERRDIDVFRGASASVVFITSIALQRDYFSLDVLQIPQGTGSGFVWDRAGHVVTNFHVIQEGDRFSVTLSDQSEWPAEVVGAAPGKDVAVLRIKAPQEKLTPLPVGRSRELLVGQRVLAVGNPFGLDHSLTVGVVSALGRELTAPNGRRIRDVVQTDAAINPGNSGGPLLDSAGRLIGVNTAIYSPSGVSSGIGFAIPADVVARLVPQLIEHGRLIEPGIGVELNATLDQLARRAGVEGVVVYRVEPGGPAEQAGLEGPRVAGGRRVVLGDVIVGLQGKPVRTQNDLLDAFEAAGAGATVTLTVARDGARRDVRMKLVAK